MKVYIANFGRGNYLWDDCLKMSSIAIMDDEAAHVYWKNRDKDGYINYCVSNMRTSKGITVTKPVASRWFNTLDIFMETNDDLWIHRQQDLLWWTTSTSVQPFSSIEVDHNRPLAKNARAYVYHKPCAEWSCTDKNGRKLSWASIHPKARQFLFTESTFQSPSKHNADYVCALIEGKDLSDWHNQPLWKDKALKSSAHVVKSYSAMECTIHRLVQTVLDTVGVSDGRQMVSRNKIKEMRMFKEELNLYIYQLYEAQMGFCALSGIKMQLDSEAEDQQLLCSLDRIDSDGHYEKGNLQLVCRFINFWKSDQKDNEFRRLLGLVQRASS